MGRLPGLMVLRGPPVFRVWCGERLAKEGRARQTLGCQAATKIRIVGIAPGSVCLG